MKTHVQTINTKTAAGLSRNMILTFLLLSIAFLGGCELVGGMLESEKRFKDVEIAAEYTGLNNKTTAVLIDAPYDIQYEFPSVLTTLTDLISLRIAMNCPDARVLPTRQVLQYQTANIYWSSMDYTDLAKDLQVQRLVVIDLIEYRLHAPGNSYLWDGVCRGEVFVYEADGMDPSTPAYIHRVEALYPTITGVRREEESRTTIQKGLNLDFTQRNVWLFHDYTRKQEAIEKEARRR